jgi:hypothetical protein
VILCVEPIAQFSPPFGDVRVMEGVWDIRDIPIVNKNNTMSSLFMAHLLLLNMNYIHKIIRSYLKVKKKLISITWPQR